MQKKPDSRPETEEAGFLVGIDTGGTHIRIGAVRKDHRIMAFEKQKTADIFCSQNVEADLVSMIRSFIARNSLSGKLVGISAGFPAIIDRNRTTVMQAPAVPQLNGLKASDILQKEFQVPVWTGRDVCMALYYDQKKYQVSDEGIVSGIYVGTGIGSCILIDGRELVGKSGAAGEIGHIPALRNDILCGCGNRGCVEMLAGGKYLASLCKETLADMPVTDLFVRASMHPAVKTYVDDLARVIASMINILDPDCMILGGGVLSMKKFPQEELTKKIHAYTRKPFPENDLNLIFAEDDPYKGVVGAAIYAENNTQNIKEETISW